MTFDEMLAAESEATTRLAEAVSLAVLIEPAFLRRARLELESDLDAGTEADVWFSEFVALRDSEGIVFHRDAADGLRQRLAASVERRHNSWSLLQQVHAGISPALQLEEEIAWLLADSGESGIPTIKERLRTAIASLVGGERVGLAHWAVQAVHRLPAAVLALDEARMLYAAARLRLGESPQAAAAIPDWMSWMLPTNYAAKAAIRLRMFPGLLEMERVAPSPGTLGTDVIQVPAVEPLGLEIDGGGEIVPVTVPPRGPTFARIGTGIVSVKAGDGAVYELTPSQDAERRRQDEIVTFAPLFAEYESLAPLIEPLQTLQAASYKGGAGLTLTGPPGSGKTGLLIAFVRGLTRPFAAHFFSDRTHRWRDADRAWTSLAAQVERHVTSVVPPAARPVERLRRALYQLPARQDPFVLVIDGLDEMASVSREVDDLGTLFGNGLPANVCVICAYESGSWFERRLRLLFEGSSSLRGVGLAHEQWLRSRQDAAKSIDPELADLLDNNLLAISVVRDLFHTSERFRTSLLRVLPPKSVQSLRPPSDPISTVASAVWQQFSEEARAILGVIAAAREPLTRFRIAEAANVSGREADAAFIDIQSWLAVGQTPDFNNTYDLIHLALKVFVRSQRGEIAGDTADERLGKTVAQWTTRDLGEFQREYSLRYALAHALAADNRARLVALLRDLDFLEARCLLEPAHRLMLEAITIFEETRHSIIEARIVADALGAAMPWLQYDPRAVRFIVDAAFRQESPTPPITGVKPVLRLRQAVESPQYGFREHHSAVLGCSPFGDNLLVSWSADTTLKTWQRSGLALANTLVGHTAVVTACHAFAMDGRSPALTLISGSRDGTVRVWPSTTSTIVTTHDAPVRGVRWTRAGIVSWDAAGAIRLSEPGAPDIQILHAHRGAVTTCLDVWPRLWSGSEDHTIRVWENLVNAGRIDLLLDPGDEESSDEMRSLRVVNRVLSERLRAGAQEIVFDDRDYEEEGVVTRIKILANLDIAERRQTQLGWLHVRSGPRLYVMQVETIPEPEGEIARLTIAQPRASSRVLEGHTGIITALIPSFLDAVVCSCSDDGTIRLWDATRLELLNTLRGHESSVLGCAVDRDNTLVSWSRDRTLRIWDQVDAHERARLVGHRGAVVGASILQNGRILSWSADGTLRLWELETGTSLAVLEGHQAPVNQAVVLDDGSIVSCSDDRTLLHWAALT